MIAQVKISRNSCLEGREGLSTLRKDELEAADDLVQSGQCLYDKRLRELLEPSQVGRYVAIEPVSGKYFLGDTGTEALLEARRVLPEAVFYLARVGYPAADTLSGYGRRVG
jgi:hypothetical protein